MSATARIATLTHRYRADDFFPVLGEEDGLYFVEPGYIGAAYIGSPMPGADDKTVDRLKSVYSLQLPAGTFLQVNHVSTPDIEPFLDYYTNARAQLRDHPDPGLRSLYTDLVTRRAEFFKQLREQRAVKGVKPTNTAYVLVSVKIPVQGKPPGEDELRETRLLITRAAEGFSAAGMTLHRLCAWEYLFYLRRLTKMFDEKEWWHSPHAPLSEQILGPGDELTVMPRKLKVNDTYIAVVSVKHYPEQSSLARMAHLVGAPDGSENQITVPFMLSLGLHFPDIEKKKQFIDKRAMALEYQMGPLARFAPVIVKKRNGIQVMTEALLNGEPPVELCLTLVLYSKDEKLLERNIASVLAFYSAQQFLMAEEKHIHLPVFLNTLPLFPSPDSIKGTFRYTTMAPSHAATFTPVLGEWQGTGNAGASLFLSRRGTPILFDLYDSSSSYNGLIVGESGGGKSFAALRMLVDYVTKGAKVWVIDLGRSFYKACKMLGGEHIQFAESSEVCLNPFTYVADINEEMDTLRALLAKMSAPEEGLDDYRYAALEEVIRSAWGATGNNTTIGQVIEYIGNHDDPRIKDLARMLFPYSPRGSHGGWFDGNNNLNFSRDLVVLEIEDLITKKTLLQVVLLQIVTKITQEFYHARDGRPKLLIIDEAKMHLEDPGMARFLSAVAATVRKHNGALVVITQSVRNFFATPYGPDILSNIPNRMILQHTAETIDWMKRENALGIGDAGYEMLKTIQTRPGQFAELMLANPDGWGVARHVEDPFFQAMFSTKGDAFHPLLRRVEAGEQVVDVIESYIEERRA